MLPSCRLEISQLSRLFAKCILCRRRWVSNAMLPCQLVFPRDNLSALSPEISFSWLLFPLFWSCTCHLQFPGCVMMTIPYGMCVRCKCVPAGENAIYIHSFLRGCTYLSSYTVKCFAASILLYIPSIPCTRTGSVYITNYRVIWMTFRLHVHRSRQQYKLLTNRVTETCHANWRSFLNQQFNIFSPIYINIHH